MKRFITFLFASIFAAQVWAADFTVGELSYEVTDSVNYEVRIGSSGYNHSANLVIPSTVENKGVTYTVTGIGDYSFWSCRDLTSVTIPNTVTYIGHSAFESCDSLTSVFIPNSVKNIGISAFRGCISLASVFIPNSVTNIDDYAFFGCYGLTSITLSDSVKSIGNGAFRNCSGVTSIKIPNSVTNIGEGAFGGCGFTSIIIPNSITSILEDTFSGCDNLTSISIPNSVISIGDNAFFACLGLTSISIPESVKSIGASAFCHCTNLKSVSIPNSVTTIGECAFEDCSNLSTITIPNSVENIGSQAFYGVKSIIYHGETEGSPWGARYINAITDENGIVYADEQKTTAIGYIGEGGHLTIPISVTNISEDAFGWCNGLTSVTIPNTITHISSGAFIFCNNLKWIAIPNSVISISQDAFFGCDSATVYCEACSQPNGWEYSWDFSVKDVIWNLQIAEKPDFKYRFNDSTATLVKYKGNSETVSIPGAVLVDTTLYPITDIGEGAFSDCKNLKIIYIPEPIGKIDANAFDGCTSTFICCAATSKPDEWSELWNKNTGTTIWGCTVGTAKNCIFEFHPNGTATLTRYEDDWKVTAVDIPAVLITDNSLYLVSSIANGIFSQCIYLNNIIIPNSITSIGERMFKNCHSFTSITIPNSVTTIGNEAFYGCKNLGSVSIPESVTTIGDRAFTRCNSLTSVSIPESVSSIGFGAFALCDNLKSVTIPNSVSSIDGYAFWNCSSLTSVTIPESITSIADGTFSDCSSLTSVTIPQSVTSIGNHAFYKCSQLESVTIPQWVATIGWKAFAECNSLTIKCDASSEPYSWEYDWNYSNRPVIWGTITAIGESDAKTVNIYANGNTIVVENATEEIRVYDAMGKLICRDAINRVRTELRVNNTGIYIVKTGNTAERIAITD